MSSVEASGVATPTVSGKVHAQENNINRAMVGDAVSAEEARISSSEPNASALTNVGSLATFSYLTASPDVARYEHPYFRSLELVLPPSLWSDSFIVARAHFTLAPRLSHADQPPMRVTSSSAHAASPLESPFDGDVLMSGRHTSASPSDMLSWSFMLIYRSDKRARDIRKERGKRDFVETFVEDQREAAPKDKHSSSSIMPIEPEVKKLKSEGEKKSSSPCAYAGGTFGEDDSLHGLSGSSCEDGTPSRDSAASSSTLLPQCTSSVSSTQTSHKSSCERVACPSAELTLGDLQESSSLGSLRMSSLPSTSSAGVSTPHQDALKVFEDLLTRVEATHNITCPLCSPARPPRWGRSAHPMTTALHLPIPQHTQPHMSDEGESAGAINCMHRMNSVPETEAAMEVRRAQLRRRATRLLQRHEERMTHLRDTKPNLFTVKVETHPLAQACARLGGLPLLRVLAATL